MALLKLQDIGKIYVSESNVAVGIRGVNLSFDKGEFVAVTGKSGSGKSTLLNVISGMDTYEEGEMLIEGNVTSHYLQPDWEQYRQEYISFIFQDYNIIESFTVLQNVELALMNIEDPKERRARALELLARVGMQDRINQKGSKLSGGQKQRTVIARALAKDSPIILADEPTGNLDSKTSEEIISLLREVSKDKLLIIVTHNFEQVENYATRHIRIFDGAVESDTVITPVQPVEEDVHTGKPEKEQSAKSIRFSGFRKGFALGKTIFASKPKFTTFLCILLIIATAAIYVITALCGENISLFNKYYMFHHTEGRVVVSSRDGGPLTEDEIKSLAEEYGAEDYLMYDMLLDKGSDGYVNINGSRGVYIGKYSLNFNKNYGKIYGRYPEADGEVFLYLPLEYKPIFGEEAALTKTVTFLDEMKFQISGIKYFYDNTKEAEILLTENAFKALSYVQWLKHRNYTKIDWDIKIDIYMRGELANTLSLYNFYASYDLEEDKIYIADTTYQKLMDLYPPLQTQTTLTLGATRSYNHTTGSIENIGFERVYTNEYFTKTAPDLSSIYYGGGTVFVHPSLLKEIADGVLSKSYNQFSLFFGTDAKAHTAEAQLREAGYAAASSDTEYEPDFYYILGDVIFSYVMIIVWLLFVIFIALFLYICTMRMLNAFKSDTAIMRSMGIPVKIIRSAMYIRMYIALIPALIFLAALAVALTVVPVLNGIFLFLHWWQYVMIILGMLFIAMFVTRKQLRRIFRTSVKKSLKGEH